MRRARVLLVGLLLGPWIGCATDDSSAQPPPAAGTGTSTQPTSEQAAAPRLPAPPVGAWVRVNQRNLLFEPKSDARLQVETEEPFRVAEVVSVDGQYVELRSVVINPKHLCDTTSGVDDDFELHFFVRIDALEPVSSEPKVFDFGDGTKLEFQAGVPVDQSETMPKLVVAGVTFEVPIGESEIGRWFPTPPARFPAEHGSERVSGKLHFGELSIEAVGPLFDRGTLGLDEALVTFISGCGRFTLRAEAGAPPQKQSGVYVMKGPRDAIPQMRRESAPDRVVGPLAAILGDDDPPCGALLDAPAGAALTYMESGMPAGVTRTAVQLPTRRYETNDEVCFAAADVAVCIANEALTRTENPACGGGDPSGRPVPSVVQAVPQVSPGLDPDIVRRIVRAHINEVRACYNGALAKRPQIAGSVTVAFEINRLGEVTSAKSQDVTLTPVDEVMTSCLTKAVRRWQFPRPQDVDSVTVTQAFEFSSK